MECLALGGEQYADLIPDFSVIAQCWVHFH